MEDDIQKRESRLRAQIIQSDRDLQYRVLTHPRAVDDPAVAARIREIEETTPRFRKMRRELDALRAHRELAAREALHRRIFGPPVILRPDLPILPLRLHPKK